MTSIPDMPAHGITVTSDEQWHDLRARNIGASDVAALFDQSPYTTRLELWLEKSGQLDGRFEDGERMRLGRHLEAGIIAAVCEEEGWQANTLKRYYECPTIPGMGCTPDALIVAPGEIGVGCLEAKNIDYLQFVRTWTDGEPPLVYILQLQHQLACTGLKWGYIVALVGGNTLHKWRYDRHEGAIFKLQAAVNTFWESVRDNVQPPAVADDYEALARVYRHDDGSEIDLTGDNEAPGLCAAILVHAEIRKKAEEAEKSAKAKLLQKIGAAQTARLSGFAVKAKTITKNMPARAASVQQYRQLTVKEITL